MTDLDEVLSDRPNSLKADRKSTRAALDRRQIRIKRSKDILEKAVLASHTGETAFADKY